MRGLSQDSESLKEQIVDICFHMKGGVTWDNAWGLSFNDRERIITRINKWNKDMSGDDTEYL